MTRFSDINRYSNGVVEQSIGSKCKSRVDLYNGTLTVILDDISFNYGSPKLSLGHVYNSRMVERRPISDGTIVCVYGKEGFGWKLTLEQQLTKVGNVLYHVGADGALTKYTRIYSVKNYLLDKEIVTTDDIEKKEKEVYINEQNPVGGIYFDNANNQYVMFDEKDNFMYYSYFATDRFRLTKIININKEEININYSDSNNISTITDSYGRRIECFYFNGNLDRVLDSTNEREIEYVYETIAEKSRLIGVNRILKNSNESERIYTFDYDSVTGKMTSIEDESKYKLTYDYDDNGAVKSVNESWYYDKISFDGNEGDSDKAGNFYNIKYLGNEDYPVTTVTTNTGINETHHFASEDGIYYFKKISYEGKNNNYGFPKNAIRGKMSLHGSSINAQLAKNNILLNGDFKTVDNNNPSNNKYWDYTVDDVEQILDVAAIQGVQGEIVASFFGTQTRKLIQNINCNSSDASKKFKGGALTLLSWVKCKHEYDVCSYKIEASYAGAESEVLDFLEDNPVLKVEDLWQCVMGSVYVPEFKYDSEDEKCYLSGLKLIVEYKGKADNEYFYINNIAVLKNSTVNSSEPYITYRAGGYIDSGADLGWLGHIVWSIVAPLTGMHTDKFSNIVFPQIINEEEQQVCDPAYILPEEANPQWFAETYKSHDDARLNKKIKLKHDGYTVEVLVKATELMYGGESTQENSGMIVKTINDVTRNPVEQFVWNHSVARVEDKAFKSVMSYDSKFRQIRNEDFRSLVTETIYTDQSIGGGGKTPTWAVETKQYHENSSNERDSDIIRSRVDNSDDGSAVKSEIDERGKMTEYSYKENDDETELVRDKLFSIELPDGTTYSYKYDERGNISEMHCGEQSFKYEYTLGLQTKITANDSDEFKYDYDGLGNIISIRHNDEVIYSAEYKTNADYSDANDVNYKIVTKNGKTYKTILDKYDNVAEVYDLNVDAENPILACEYNADTNEMSKLYDNAVDGTGLWSFISDINGNTDKVEYKIGNTTNYVSDKYYSHNLLKRNYKTIGFANLNETYNYYTDADKGIYPDRRLESVRIDGGQSEHLATANYVYDTLGRVTHANVKQGLNAYNAEHTVITNNYDYANGPENDTTTNFVSKLTVSVNQRTGETTNIVHNYTYDDKGNIIKDECGDKVTEYFYDEYDRLIREDNYTEIEYDDGPYREGTTTIYLYDEKGNILGKQKLTYGTVANISYNPTPLVGCGTKVSNSLYCGESYTKTATNTGVCELNGKAFTPYEYDSNGRLVKANGNTYIYDSYGRPTTYNGKELEWDGSKFTKFGDYEMTYDCRGYRTSKTDGSRTSKYFYDEQGNLLQEIHKSGNTTTDTVTYLYDSTGVIGFTIKYVFTANGREYESQKPFYYVKDLLGNICEIVDTNGVSVVKYNYDAWGNIVSTEHNALWSMTLGSRAYTAYNISNLSGFGYRGYYYDSDLELYYLINRYYDSFIGRFISPDDPKYLDFETLFGQNGYAYCVNNPITGYDPEGTWDLKNAWNRFCNKYVKPVVTRVKIGLDWIRQNVGFAYNVANEEILDKQYAFVAEAESGVGYTKTFDTGKPINFFINRPKDWWRLDQYQIGLDVNFDGKGAAITLGGEYSISIHSGQVSHDFILGNSFGRISYKLTLQDDNGGYEYMKFSLNAPEIAMCYLLSTALGPAAMAIPAYLACYI